MAVEVHGVVSEVPLKMKIFILSVHEGECNRGKNESCNGF